MEIWGDRGCSKENTKIAFYVTCVYPAYHLCVSDGYLMCTIYQLYGRHDNVYKKLVQELIAKHLNKLIITFISIWSYVVIGNLRIL